MQPIDAAWTLLKQESFEDAGPLPEQIRGSPSQLPGEPDEPYKRFGEWDNIQQNINTLTNKIESLNRDKERIQTALGYGVSSREEHERKERLFYELDDEMVKLIYQRKELEEKLQNLYSNGD